VQLFAKNPDDYPLSRDLWERGIFCFAAQKKHIDTTDISVYHKSKGVVVMKTNTAIREVMQQQRISISALASKIGKSPRLISDRLSQKNISIEKLNELLQVLDYKIVIVPRSYTAKSGEYEVE
jgi:ribosome-binding protein aMBF1 (putative translation factor)